MSKVDEASIALWMPYRREPGQFARLPEAWQRSIAENYAGALKWQRPAALPISVLAALEAITLAIGAASPGVTHQVLTAGIEFLSPRRPPVRSSPETRRSRCLISGRSTSGLRSAAASRCDSARHRRVRRYGPTRWADEDSDDLEGDGCKQRTLPAKRRQHFGRRVTDEPRLSMEFPSLS